MKQHMDIQKVFHMKGGNGDHSYSNNSSLQKRVADKVKHITLQAMEETLEATRTMSLGIADLGCSSGPNTLSNVKQLVQTVERACSTTTRKNTKQQQQQLVPEFRVYLNDLPTNDFNTIFQALPDLYRDLNKPPNNNINHHQIYIAGYPGTFYGRLFPDNCLHFVYSSNSLHWLSTVPEGIFDENGLSINKKSIYISERSPVQVSEAYLKQFRQDFSLFLKSRSRELVAGGRMVLILLGRRSADVDTGNSFFWEILYQSLATLVHQGEIEEEKLESYEVHFYAPSKEELEEEVRKEGSFKVELTEMFEMDKDIIDASGNSNNNYPSYGVAVAKTVRSIQESMIASHFGESIDLDKLFDLYGRLVDQELAKHEDDDEDMIRSITTVLVLTKL